MDLLVLINSGRGEMWTYSYLFTLLKQGERATKVSLVLIYIKSSICIFLSLGLFINNGQLFVSPLLGLISMS